MRSKIIKTSDGRVTFRKDDFISCHYDKSAPFIGAVVYRLYVRLAERITGTITIHSDYTTERRARKAAREIAEKVGAE